MLTLLGARFYDFVVVDWFSTWYISLLGGIDSEDSDPNHEISISVLETRQEEKKKHQKANIEVRIIVHKTIKAAKRQFQWSDVDS